MSTVRTRSNSLAELEHQASQSFDASIAAKLTPRHRSIPGRLFKRSHTKDYERSGRMMTRLRNRLKQKRTLTCRGVDDDESGRVGRLSVSVLGGSFCTSRPYIIAEVDGNEQRTETAKSHQPRWDGEANPKAEFSFPVFDPSSDLRLFLFDDSRVHNELCVGRVIVPLRNLCTRFVLPMPLPEKRYLFRIMPSAPQHNPAVQERFDEAVPHVPGTGMVKPSEQLGVMEIQLRLTLDAPGSRWFGLLAAYAVPRCAPADDEDSSEGDTDDQKPPSKLPLAETTTVGGIRQTYPKLKSQVLRLLSIRLHRCTGACYILRSPWCLGLLPVNYYVCFVAALHELPWIAFFLILANGILAHHYCAERTEGMIFWEESVGESDMPRGREKLRRVMHKMARVQQAVVVFTTALERAQNLTNFTDPAVSLVAFAVLAVACGALSVMLRAVPVSFLAFLALSTAVGPFEARAFKQFFNVAEATDSAAHSPRTEWRHGHPKLEALLGAPLNVLARVPDGTDVAHNYFCSTQSL